MHQTRTILILTAILLACSVALYFGAQWFQGKLTDTPYLANVKGQLRAFAAAEEAYKRDSLSYTKDIVRVWQPSAETQGVQLRMLSVTADGLLTEGRHDGWKGRCVIALGTAARDTLPAGEPVCYWNGH